MKEVFAHNRPDKTLAIDAEAGALVLVRGEKAIVRFEEVEDMRADPAILECLRFGTVTLTNLRIAWNSNGDPNGHSINIGLSTIVKISVGNLHAGAGKFGTDPDSSTFINSNRSVVLHATYNQTNYKVELKPRPRSFTQANMQLFDVLQLVYRAHDTTRMYRRVRVRSSTVRDGQPVLLAREVVLDSLHDVKMMSAIGVGDISGTLVRTSHRILWFATSNELHNVSLPYIDILGLSLKSVPGKDKAANNGLLIFSIPMCDGARDFAAPDQEVDKKAPKSKANKNKGISGYQIAKFAFNITTAIPPVSIEDFYTNVLLGIQKAQMNPDYGIEISEYESMTGAPLPAGSLDKSLSQGPSLQMEESGSNRAHARANDKMLKIVQAVVSRSNFSSQYITSVQGMQSNAAEDGAGESSANGLPSISFDQALGVAFQTVPGKSSLEDIWKL